MSGSGWSSRADGRPGDPDLVGPLLAVGLSHGPLHAAGDPLNGGDECPAGTPEPLPDLLEERVTCRGDRHRASSASPRVAKSREIASGSAPTNEGFSVEHHLRGGGADLAGDGRSTLGGARLIPCRRSRTAQNSATAAARMARRVVRVEMTAFARSGGGELQSDHAAPGIAGDARSVATSRRRRASARRPWPRCSPGAVRRLPSRRRPRRGSRRPRAPSAGARGSSTSPTLWTRPLRSCAQTAPAASDTTGIAPAASASLQTRADPSSMLGSTSASAIAHQLGDVGAVPEHMDTRVREQLGQVARGTREENLPR